MKKIKNRAIIRDKIMNYLLSNMGNGGCGLYSKHAPTEELREKELLIPRTEFANSGFDLSYLPLLRELNNEGYIRLITSTASSHHKDGITYCENLGCKEITWLGKVKMEHGGFLKEYNDTIETKRNWRITIITLTIVFITLLVDVLTKINFNLPEFIVVFLPF